VNRFMPDGVPEMVERFTRDTIRKMQGVARDVVDAYDFGDEVSDSAIEAIDTLERYGIDIVMLGMELESVTADEALALVARITDAARNAERVIRNPVGRWYLETTATEGTR